MSRYVSFIIQSWQDDDDGAMRWKVRSVHSDEQLSLPDASFVVRTWIDDHEQMIRGLIRHVQSGQEVQFQSSERAMEFIRAWVDVDPPTSIGGDLGMLEPPASTGPFEREGLPDEQSL